MVYVEFMCDTAAISEFAVRAQANTSMGDMNIGVLQDRCLRAAPSPLWLPRHQHVSVPGAGSAGSRGAPDSPLPLGGNWSQNSNSASRWA